MRLLLVMEDIYFDLSGLVERSFLQHYLKFRDLASNSLGDT